MFNFLLYLFVLYAFKNKQCISRFATSWHTLTWVPDTFFTALLSGRIPTVRDETGAIFIDRDPNLFGLILNFLRTRDIDLNDINIRALRHECDYFGITPLSRRLALCDEMTHSSCGDVLFYGYLPPPCKYFILHALLNSKSVLLMLLVIRCKNFQIM